MDLSMSLITTLHLACNVNPDRRQLGQTQKILRYPEVRAPESELNG